MKGLNKIPLRHCFKVLSGSTPKSGEGFYWDGDICWVTPEDISNLSEGYRLYDTKRKITEEGYNETGVTLVPINSLVLTKRAPIGLLAILGVEACSNQGCFLLVPKQEIVPEFYYYYLFANKEYLHILGRGSTFMELSLDDIKSFKIPDYSKQKQKKIANFLDKETEQIDSLIKFKENQLKLLSEKKQSLITQALTKGLNLNVKTKVSGIDFLTKVPIHWIEIRMKYLGNIFYGLSQPPKYQTEGVALIRATNVFRGLIKKEGLVYVDENEIKSDKKINLKRGDIIVVRSGAYTGDSAIVTKEWEDAIAGFDMILRPNEKVIPEFLAIILLCSYVLNYQILPLRIRAAQPHLNAEELGGITVLLPNKDEQREIVNYLEFNLSKIRKIEVTTQKSIDLLKERRVSLIKDAISGQVEIPI